MSLVRTATVLIATLVICSPAAAAPAPPIVVGNGTAGSCNGTAFLNALDVARTERGGRIQFDCGGGPATIVVMPTGIPGAITLPNRTTIDGGGLIVVSVAQVYDGPSLIVGPGPGVAIKNLALDAKLLNLGRLLVENVTFAVHDAIGLSTVRNAGTLTLRSSRFGDAGSPSFSLAAPVVNQRAMIVDRTEFVNLNGAGIGAIWNTATMAVYSSVFSANFGDIAGAIFNGDGSGGGKLTIANCEFTFNAGYDSGAIFSDGVLAVIDSNLADNASVGPGAAMTANGTTVVRRSSFLRNAGYFGGAMAVGGTLNIERSRFSENHAAYGGALYIQGAVVTVAGSAITSNDAEVDGGGIYVVGSAPRLIRTTLTANTPSDITVLPDMATSLPTR